MTHTQMMGDRRGLNPHLLFHREACTNQYTTATIRCVCVCVCVGSPSWNRTNITGFKGRLTATDRGRNADATNEVRSSSAPFGLRATGGAIWNRTDNELTAARGICRS